MDLGQLEYFARVAGPGSFTRAAGVLDGAQPALRRQVRLLAGRLDIEHAGYAVSTSPRPEAFVMRRIVRPRLRSRLEIATSSRRATTLTQQAMLALIRDVAAKAFAAASA